MKTFNIKAFIFAVMVFSFTQVWAQNLVLNPSFEDHIPCPLYYAELSECNDWFFVGGSQHGFSASDDPCYFTKCSSDTDLLRVPNIQFGYQYPRTGNAMIGIQSTFYNGPDTNLGELKTFPQDSLSSSLIKGRKYHIGCYVNLGNLSMRANFGVVTDNFGIYISDSIVPVNKLYFAYKNMYGFPAWTVLYNLVPQIINPKGRLLSDTLSWMLVDGIYTAKGGEKFITLGSFAKSLNSKFNHEISSDQFENYLYVDDVFVIPVFDSLVQIVEHDTTLCTGQQLVLHTNMPWSTHLQWNNGNTADSLIVNKAGTYWVRFDSASFSNTDTIHIQYDSVVNTIPNALVACVFPDTFYASSSMYHYTWPDSSTGNSFIFKNPGKYLYSIASGHCKATESIIVQSGVFPIEVFPADTVICSGHPMKISLNNFSGSILWQDGNTSDDYIITKGGNYSLTLKNQCGTRTYTSTIFDSNCDCFLYVPDAFSPNGDHRNDSFIQASNCITEKYSLQIYNRWGEMIFQSNDINHGWNGTNEYGGNGIYKSPHSPPGVYIYKIMYKFQHGTEQEKMGTVEVMR